MKDLAFPNSFFRHKTTRCVCGDHTKGIPYFRFSKKPQWKHRMAPSKTDLYLESVENPKLTPAEGNSRMGPSHSGYGTTHSGYDHPGLVQGWESECWGVPGIHLLENRKVCRICQISISCFRSIWNSYPWFWRFYLTIFHNFPVPVFTKFDEKWDTRHFPNKTVHMLSKVFKTENYSRIYNNYIFQKGSHIFLIFFRCPGVSKDK